jgi:hypothetical protein
VLSLEAGLSALIPQAATSLGFDTAYMKHTQRIFDTIKRQPLLVGFANGDTDFGWIFGPKFGFDEDGHLVWSHTPIQYSVQASVVVPGWWSQLKLDATSCWLSADKAEPMNCRTTDATSFTVKLPADYSAITRALLAQKGQLLNQPSILPRWDANASRQRITVKQGKDETILIRGRNLWRNPKVLLGSQTADQVEILPDMAGLIASFKNIHMPDSSLPGPQLVDLSVVTSGGMSVLRDGVQILPGE